MKRKMPVFAATITVLTLSGALVPTQSYADSWEVDNMTAEDSVDNCAAYLLQGVGSSLPFTPGLDPNPNCLEVYVLAGAGEYMVLTTNLQGDFTLPLGVKGAVNNINNYLSFSFSPDQDFPSNDLTTAEIFAGGSTNVLDVGSNFLANGSFNYGLPNLTASNTNYGLVILNIVPKSSPNIENTLLSKTNKSMDFNINGALPGETLDLEYTTDLNNGPWSSATNFYIPVSINNFGTNVSIPMPNLLATDKCGFYRVKVE